MTKKCPKCGSERLDIAKLKHLPECTRCDRKAEDITEYRCAYCAQVFSESDIED